MHHGHMLHRPFVIGNPGMVSWLGLICLYQSVFGKPAGRNAISYLPETTAHFPDVHLGISAPHIRRAAATLADNHIHLRPGIAARFPDPNQFECFFLHTIRRF